MINRLLTTLQQAGLILSDEELAAYSEATSLLHPEEIADALWLAAKMRPTETSPVVEEAIDPSPPTVPTVVMGGDSPNPVAPPPPAVAAYLPESTKQEEAAESSPEEGLPIQVQAAPALLDSRLLGRALRPLMHKVPSLSRAVLDEAATVDRIAERDLWVPVLKPNPERWFDLELVVEASKFSFIWQETLTEFQRVLECQGAFRNVRSWSIEGVDAGELRLVPKKQRGEAALTQPARSPKELVDTSGRRLVLLVSDCRSLVWQQGKIHDWLKIWSQHGPTAVVQLLPEGLWEQSELDVGKGIQVSALMPGAPNDKLQMTGLPKRSRMSPANALTLPIVTLTEKSLKQWALVVAAAGRQRAPARLFDLIWVKDANRDASTSVVMPQSAAERVELFEATASPIAQRLAGMMAAVPVSLSVVHLIQKRLLPEAKPVHVAEVYSSALLVPASQQATEEPTQYDFAGGVRGLLNKTTPLDETLAVLDELSKEIASTLDLPAINSFTALLAPKRDWTQATKEAVLPFAQIATQVLHRLGGEFAELAQAVEQEAAKHTNWIQTEQIEPSFPDLQVLDFVTARFEEGPYLSPDVFPQLQTEEFTIATISLELEPDPAESELEPFEFHVATLVLGQIPEGQSQSNSPLSLPPLPPGLPPPPPGLPSSSSGASFPSSGSEVSQQEQQKFGWMIQYQQRQAYRLVEVLTDDLILEMVSIPAGTFVMGSPEEELDRFDDEGPQHEVTVGAFLIGRYPVTQAQWRFVAQLPQVNQELDLDPSFFKRDTRPVENVSWYEAVEFCARLSAYIGREYRLPSEAEWEYACRAGTTTPFHFGETITTDLANYRGTDDESLGRSGSYGEGPKGEYREETTSVDHFGIANAFGLCDMYGNVWEWCQDHWHSNYEGAPTDGSAWLSENEGAGRVRRGGSWNDNPRYCRSAYRNHLSPRVSSNWLGCRVVCSAPRTL